MTGLTPTPREKLTRLLNLLVPARKVPAHDPRVLARANEFSSVELQFEDSRGGLACVLHAELGRDCTHGHVWRSHGCCDGGGPGVVGVSVWRGVGCDSGVVGSEGLGWVGDV